MSENPPTHTLVLEVPLALGGSDALHFDAVQDALRITLALSRLAAYDVLCGDPQATVRTEPSASA